MPRRTFVNTAAIARVSRTLTDRKNAGRRASRLGVTVGIHEEEGSEDVEGGATLADVAFFHEMGTSNIPRRSWLLDGIEEEQSTIDEAMRRAGIAVVTKRLTPDAAYLQLGELIVAKLQARIRANIPPPLSAATIERKGSSTPLIDEGRLIASIRAKVTSE